MQHARYLYYYLWPSEKLIQQHIFRVKYKTTPFLLDSFDRRIINIMTMYTLDKDTIMPFILIYGYISINTAFNIYRAQDTPTKILQIRLLSMHSCQHCRVCRVCVLCCFLSFPVLPCSMSLIQEVLRHRVCHRSVPQS